MDRGSLNTRVFDRLREHKSERGYKKQMREETEKLIITDKKCVDREQKLKEIKVLVENKEKQKGTAWSKERKQRQAEMMRRYWDKKRERKSNDFRVIYLKRPFREKKITKKVNNNKILSLYMLFILLIFTIGNFS